MHPDVEIDASAGAQAAAAAALRELPEALILAYDEQMQLILAAGQPLTRVSDPDVCRTGSPLRSAFPASMWRVLEPVFASALAGENRTREVWGEDSRRCLLVDAGPLRLAGPGRSPETAPVSGGLAVVIDATERRAAAALSRPTAGFEQVFEEAPVGTGLLDREGRWLLVNRALCEITGYTPEELVGMRFDGIIHPEDVYRDIDERERLLRGEIETLQARKRYFDASGETVCAIVSMSLVRDRDGAPLHYIAQLQDVSERRSLEGELRSLADHDGLTGLRNRRLFANDLRLQLARCRRYGEEAGLLVIDIEGLTEVNARHGRNAGDQVLRAVGRALTRRLRETDLVARVGGGEFAVMLPHIDEEGIAVVAENLARVIPAGGVDVGEEVVHPRAAIGTALLDADTESPGAALAAARRSTRPTAGGPA